jgi:hypothetical protein
MDIGKNNSLFVKISILSLGLFVLVLFLSITLPGKAHAAEDGNNVPWWVRLELQAMCDSTGNIASQSGWLSRQGQPLQTSATLPFGSTSVQLQYNLVVKKCPGRSVASLSATTYGIVGTNPPNIPGLTGAIAAVSYAGLNDASAPYSTSQIPFTISIAPLTEPGGRNITVNTVDKKINYRTNGTWQCVTNAGEVNYYVPANIFDFGACRSTGGASLNFLVIPDIPQQPPDAPPTVTLTANCSNLTGNASDPQGAVSVEAQILNDSGNPIWTSTQNNINGIFNFVFPSQFKDAHKRNVRVIAYNNSTGTQGGAVNTSASRTIDRCLRPSCSINTNPANPSINSPFNINFAWQYQRLGDPAPGSQARVVNPDASLSFNGSPSVSNTSIGASTLGGSTIFGPYTISSAGNFSGNGSISYSDALDGTIYNDDCGNNGAAAIVVYTKPYFKIYGNDAMAGSRFTINGACSTTLNTSATFIGFNESGTTVPNGTNSYLRGAGAQHALFALATITEVPSAGLRPNPDSTNPLNLGSGSDVYPSRQTFANSTTSAPLADYGGGSGISRCIPDYFSESTSTPVAGSLVTPGSGASDINLIGSVEITGATNILSVTQTIYINGDARISGNIEYGSFTDVASAPNITVVVKGNLYIDKSVNTISGTFISQPTYNPAGDYLSGGNIYTCTDGFNIIPKQDLEANCSQKLNIKGALLAKSVKLWRTNGDVSNSPLGAEDPTSANISESLLFSPEIYLKANNVNGGYSGSKYDSIKTLPPTF